MMYPWYVYYGLFAQWVIGTLFGWILHAIYVKRWKSEPEDSSP